jgi:hypothetical protein
VRRTRIAQVAAVAVVLLALSAGTGAGYGPAPVATWVVSGGTEGGTVETVAVSGKTAYVGGDFGYVGPETGSFVSLDASNGTVAPAWPLVDGTVSAVVSDGAGGWFVGGSFASVGTRHADNLAHVGADGALDTAFQGGTDGPVYALARSGGTLFVGGFFTHAGTFARAGLAAFDSGTGAVVAGFDPGIAGDNPFVSALALSGATLYVGGLFDTLGGQPRDNLGALTTAGTVTAWNPHTNDLVNAIALGPAPSNTVYVGGFFDTVNTGTIRHFAAAFDPASGTATSWDPRPNGAVYALVVANFTVYLGGSFTTVFGAARNAAAAVDADTATLDSWDPNVTGAVYQLAASGTTIYAAGSFQTVNGGTTSRDNVALFDNSTGTAVEGFAPVVGGDVFALGLAGTSLVAGGAFHSAANGDPGTFRRDNLAAVDLPTGLPTSWNPHTNDIVFALAVSGSTVYVGGGFTRVNGSTLRNGLAAFGASVSTALQWNPNVNGNVFALAVLGGTVYAGGDFTTASGLTRNRVAALGATGAGSPLSSWNPGANGTVYALDAWNNTVYLGGDFTTVGGQTRTRLAAVDTSAAVTPWNPNASDTVYVLSHAGSTEYAGGAFTKVNGTLARGAAAAFDAGGSGAATSWNPRLALDATSPAVVISLAPKDSTMYLGGIFHTAGDCATSCFLTPDVAAVSLASGAPVTTWQPVPNNVVNAVAISPQGLVVGGTFTALGYPPPDLPFTADEPDATYHGGFALVPALAEAPANVSATQQDHSITVSFEPPPSDGGAPVTSYTATESPDGVTMTGTGPFTFTGLSLRTNYTFSVTATTIAGTGAAAVVTTHLEPPPPPAPAERPAVPDVPTTITTPRLPPPHHA